MFIWPSVGEFYISDKDGERFFQLLYSGLFSLGGQNDHQERINQNAKEELARNCRRLFTTNLPGQWWNNNKAMFILLTRIGKLIKHRYLFSAVFRQRIIRLFLNHLVIKSSGYNFTIWNPLRQVLFRAIYIFSRLDFHFHFVEYIYIYIYIYM